jgi:thiamine-phosphate pyrophosphorylase
MIFPELRGLYLLLDPAVCQSRSLVDVLKEAADHGVRLFQYRDKTATMSQAYQTGSALRKAAAEANAWLIVNDRCDLALAIDADGAHVGQQDLPLSEARRLLGEKKVLGISTHTPAQVAAAVAERPDYIAYGPIFPTATKPDHEPVVGITGLVHIRRMVPLPLFAIGGISADRVEEIRKAGADGVAVSAAVLRSADMGLAIDRFISQFPKSNRPAY